jgi:hypothetical protein
MEVKMAIAYKCDRCGKLYEKYNSIDGFFNATNASIYKPDAPLYTKSKHYNLCQDCMKQLQIFLNGQKEE